MGTKLRSPVGAARLAQALGAALRGDDMPVDSVAPLNRVVPGALTFSKRETFESEVTGAVFLVPPGASPIAGSAVIEVPNPRLAFARALVFLEAESGFISGARDTQIHPTAVVSSSAVIGRGVRIGARTVVRNFVVIADDVEIGEDCDIKSGAVIGEAGFGFERAEDGMPIRLLHLGSVVIGNRVEIGSLTTVCRGTMADTRIEDDAKVDDHVHVAHNCIVGRGSLITACAELSGGVTVGERSWIGPNTSVIQQTEIGAGALVGIGANVTRDVEPGAKVAGNPAKPLGDRQRS